MQTRIYPKECTSMYCGNTSESCPNCQYYPKLKEFKQWVIDNKAICKDYIWNPLIYTATGSNNG